MPELSICRIPNTYFFSLWPIYGVYKSVYIMSATLYVSQAHLFALDSFYGWLNFHAYIRVRISLFGPWMLRIILTQDGLGPWSRSVVELLSMPRLVTGESWLSCDYGRFTEVFDGRDERALFYYCGDESKLVYFLAYLFLCIFVPPRGLCGLAF